MQLRNTREVRGWIFDARLSDSKSDLHARLLLWLLTASSSVISALLCAGTPVLVHEVGDGVNGDNERELRKLFPRTSSTCSLAFSATGSPSGLLSQIGDCESTMNGEGIFQVGLRYVFPFSAFYRSDAIRMPEILALKVFSGF